MRERGERDGEREMERVLTSLESVNRCLISRRLRINNLQPFDE